MAGEDRDGGAKAPVSGDADAEGAPLRIESGAIAWSWREQERAHALGWAVAVAVMILAVFRLDEAHQVSPWVTRVALFALYSQPGGIKSIGFRGGAGRKEAKRGFVERRGEELVIATRGDERRIRLDDIRQGWIEDLSDQGEACNVVLRFRNRRDVAVRVADRAEAARLLRGTRCTGGTRAVRVPLRNTAARWRYGDLRYGDLVACVGLLGFPSLLSLVLLEMQSRIAGTNQPGALDDALHFAIFAARTALAVIALLGIIRVLCRREVIVGTDGVALSGFGKRRFIAYSSVHRAKRDPEGVRLYLKEGGSVLLPTIVDSAEPLPLTRDADTRIEPEDMKQSFPRDAAAEDQYRIDAARRDALLALVKRAMRARGRSRVAQAQLATLDRGSRSLPTWRDDLRAILAAQGSGYREATIGADQLAEVVEDAGATPEHRIAAAIALSGNEDAEARRRVRIAVDACADEDLRAALAQAAEGEMDEAELRRALRVRG